MQRDSWACSFLHLWLFMMQGNLDIQVAPVRITNWDIEGRDMFSFASVWYAMTSVASPLRILRTALLWVSVGPLDLKIFGLLPSTSRELKNSLRFFFRGNWCLKGLCLKNLYLQLSFLLFMLLERCLQYSFFTRSIHFHSGNRKQLTKFRSTTFWVFPSTCQQISLLKIELCDYISVLWLWNVSTELVKRHLNRSCG